MWHEIFHSSSALPHSLFLKPAYYCSSKLRSNDQIIILNKYSILQDSIIIIYPSPILAVIPLVNIPIIFISIKSSRSFPRANPLFTQEHPLYLQFPWQDGQLNTNSEAIYLNDCLTTSPHPFERLPPSSFPYPFATDFLYQYSLLSLQWNSLSF